MNYDNLIDLFVQRINGQPLEPIWYDEVPESVQNGEKDSEELFRDWQIKRFDASAWIAGLQLQLTTPLPPSFLSLVCRYIFPRFVLGEIQFWANTPEGVSATYELRTAVLNNGYCLSPFLLENGFIPFARPEDDYDAICFDTKSATNGEFRIVRIEHEIAMNRQQILITEVMFSSFHELIGNYLIATESK